ncbi:MAG: diguanylate cyclase, partial [Candidatus Dadabacteria bacterium]|nr:diguanylate cyclase [Candidatus Dadabacteria bacterium]
PLLKRIYSIFLSVIVLYLIYTSGFQGFSWYSFLAALLLIISIIHRLSGFIKYRTGSSLIERLEVALLLTLFFEALFESFGRELFPLLYVLTPIFFAYLGWREALFSLALIIIIEATTGSKAIESIPELSILLISTFGLGYLIKRNENFKDVKKHLMSIIEGTSKRIFTPDRAKETLELTQPPPIFDKKLKSDIRNSIELLNGLLSPHSALLYIKGKDELFVITDFISESDKYIDGSQMVHIRGGYLGWVLKTKTPIMVGEIKNHRENLIYYTKIIPVKSILAVPIILKEEEDTPTTEDDVIGILVADSLKEDAFQEKDKQIAMLLSNRIADTLIRYRLAEKVQLSIEGQTSFYDYAHKLSSTLELDTILNHAITSLGEAIESDIIGLTLIDSETNTSILMRTGLERRIEIEGKTIQNQNTLVGLVSETQKYFYSDDLSAREKYRTVFGREIDFAWGINKIKSIFIYPLKEPTTPINQEGENTIGCIIMGRKGDKAFTKEERSLIETMSKEAANSISNSLTYLRAKELSIRDGLTGLYNRRYFQERLAQEIARADRFPEKLSLVLMDVDNFKHINDTYGHEAGDLILISLAQLISESLRRIDIAARYGGDEFAILLLHTNEKGSKTLGEKIKHKVEQSQLKFEGRELSVTVSLGIATSPETEPTMDDLIQRADRALYQAKRLGKNRTLHYVDIAEEAAK